MKLNTATLAIAIAFTSAPSFAQNRVTERDVQAIAVCYAWSTSILKSPSSFPEEWRKLVPSATYVGAMLQDTGRVNLKENTDFQETVKVTQSALQGEPASPQSPLYARIYQTCVNWMSEFMDREAAADASAPSKK